MTTSNSQRPLQGILLDSPYPNTQFLLFCSYPKELCIDTRITHKQVARYAYPLTDCRGSHVFWRRWSHSRSCLCDPCMDWTDFWFDLGISKCAQSALLDNIPCSIAASFYWMHIDTSTSLSIANQFLYSKHTLKGLTNRQLATFLSDQIGLDIRLDNL